jgi:hypothetical protein
MKASWATLPAELREKIYISVLTEPSGLIWRAGADGIDRVYARKREAERVGLLRGHLLALSRYLYGGLSAISLGAANDAEQLEFNQIQYVSRQCYREAHGLESRYNNILFEDRHGTSAGQRCRKFVNNVVKQRHAQYLNLSIRGRGFSFQSPGHGSSPVTLVQFCMQHPRASLILHHPRWSQRSPGFLLLGLAYAAAIRDQKLLEQLVEEQGPTLDFDLAAIRSSLPREGVPPNFRLAPWEDNLDRPMLCESLTQCLFFKGQDSSVWLDVAERWFIDGL